MPVMWFESWSDIARVVLVGCATYAFLVVVLRSFGGRTLAQLNAFDFIVTVALGSTLATALLSSDVTWAEGAVALAVLVALQFAIAWISSRWPSVRGAVTASPHVLLREGAIDERALRAARLTEAEVRQAVRASGAGDLSGVAAVVLETNGTLSVIPSSKMGDGSALSDLPV